MEGIVWHCDDGMLIKVNMTLLLHIFQIFLNFSILNHIESRSPDSPTSSGSKMAGCRHFPEHQACGRSC